jgi:BMFP domain-containing protein YqiC
LENLTLPDINNQREKFESYKRTRDTAKSLKTEINQLESSLNSIVHSMYGLSEEEINIIDTAVGDL